MSLLKISDPAKRDFIIEEFLKTKKNIKQNFLSERIDDLGLQRELTKIYKPIVDSQSAISKEQNALLSTIKDNSAATSLALKSLPDSLKTIQFPQYPSIEAYDDDDPVEDIRRLELGNIAVEYLKKYASDKRLVDTTFGLRSRDGKFYIGDSEASIQGNDITVGTTTYQGTPGLWELLTLTDPNRSIYDNRDLEEYAEILIKTNAMSQPNKPNKPKSSRSVKYAKIIKPIWDDYMKLRGKTGSGIITIPSDPNELVKQLELRIYSYKAGNTGVRNEIVGMTDELLRQGVITKDEYKKLMI
jgi:hypothetical protein